MPEMLADGTNPERVDPDPPLRWTDKSCFKDVRVINKYMSPPCAKVRYHLAHTGIPFTVEDDSIYMQDKEKGKNYKKVPILFNDGRQVNDSFIICKHLIPALYGPDAFNEEWEVKITYGFMVAMEVETFEDKSNWPVCVTWGGAPSFVATLLPCILPFNRMAAFIRARRARHDDIFGPMKTATEYLDEFKAELADKKFHGGNEPNSVDVSLFGTVYTWSAAPGIMKMLEKSGLTQWFANMQEKMPKTVLGD